MASIKKRREQIGTSTDMAVRVAELLEAPNKKRDLARRALASGFKTDPETFTNLCSDLDDELYLSELVKLCLIIDIPIHSRTTKAEIIHRLQEYVKEALTCTNNLHTSLSITQAQKMLQKCRSQIKDKKEESTKYKCGSSCGLPCSACLKCYEQCGCKCLCHPPYWRWKPEPLVKRDKKGSAWSNIR